ncbi:MAG: DUF2793 domain-containing protein [Proteobacteria bacterium]|nr:DUF2793 domain-containing protein [Pseudomonadota bacterium]
MTEAIFESRTARLDLPLLFAGQAQKEIHVNEALARIDAMLCLAVEGEAARPPASPSDGQAWLIASSPSAEWAGRPGQIAARQSGNWLFFRPQTGMQLLNRANGQMQRFDGAWRIPARPALPSGGATIDVEARNAIVAILQVMTTAGIIPA